MLGETHGLPPEAVALEGPGDVEPGDPYNPVVCEVEVGVFLGAQVEGDVADGDEGAVAGCARLFPLSGCCVCDWSRLLDSRRQICCGFPSVSPRWR